MKRLITASLAMLMISCCCTQSAHASVWGDLIALSKALKGTNTDHVIVWNNSNRITKFKIKKGDGTMIGSTGPVYPGQIAIPIGTYPNPNQFRVKAYVFNERRGYWVEKTGWIRFTNPGMDVYVEFFHWGNGTYDLDWLD